jgi:DNA (cytosine-5)-methyltransferase 1
VARKKHFTHGSFFSGVGGMDLGFDRAGIKTLWQCEVDAKCRSVLARHWPDAVRYEDIADVDGAELKPVDIITFGSPCQDLSIAGKRQGMKKGSGTRSSLFFEAIRVIREMQEATDGKYPQLVIWENVAGALSSRDGKDFKAAVDALAGIGALDVSYRLVNALQYGPPQRRVRVLVVADTRRQRAGEILAEPSRVLWHPAPSGEAGQETAGGVEDSAGAGGWRTVREVTSSLSTKGVAGTRIDAEDADGGHLVVSDVTGCLTKNIANGPDLIHAECNQLVVGALTTKCGDTQDDQQTTQPVTYAAVDREGKAGGGKGLLLKEEQSLTLKATNSQVLFVKERHAKNSEDFETWVAKQIAPTLSTFENASDTRATVVALEPSYRVRRLTPRECERLMGWDDDHTRWAETGEELKDGPRYRMIGNGISAPMAQWLGEAIVKHW